MCWKTTEETSDDYYDRLLMSVMMDTVAAQPDRDDAKIIDCDSNSNSSSISAALSVDGDVTTAATSVVPDDSDKLQARSQPQYVTATVAVPRTPAKTSAGTTSSSQHIHLWQFLKELLTAEQHTTSATIATTAVADKQPQPPQQQMIRWLDREQGVFKIEDSQAVARLWGCRKNRPAMNYDKLSRSLRQYYKKGIMQKTERSQRLVYQFCHPYNA